MPPTLNPEELSALMSAIQDSRVPASQPATTVPVVPYDLTGHDRIIRGQLPTLDAINERVASIFATGLAGRVRQSIRVGSLPATLMKFADLAVLFAPPATLCVLSLGRGHGHALAALESGLADSLLAAALGDRRPHREESGGNEPRREQTTVERLVLKRLLLLLCEAMRVSWAEVLPLAPDVVRFESDPRLATVAAPNDVAVLSTFEVSGAITGRLQLAVPYASVETAKKLLSSPPRMNYGGDTRFTDLMAEELTQVDVELSAVLGVASMSLKDLLALEVGEVVVLPTSETDPLTVLVEGRPKLLGSPQVSGGSVAVALTSDLARPAVAEKPELPARPPAAGVSPAAAV